MPKFKRYIKHNKIILKIMTEQELRNLIRKGIELVSEENARTLDAKADKKLKQIILSHLKGGRTIAQAAQMAGISTATYYKWAKSDSGFATKAEKMANESVMEGAMSDIHIMAKEAKDVKDFMKKFYKAYGDKVKDNLTGREWVQELYKDMNESVNEAKEYDLGLTDARKYEMTLGKAISKLDGIKAYDKAMAYGGGTAVQDISDRIRISQYGNPLTGTGTDNTDALKKILKKADSNLDVNTIKSNFSAIAAKRSKHHQDKDIWYYDVDKKINYHKAKKMGIIAKPPVTKMSHDVVIDLMDMMAGYTSDANPMADIEWNSLASFMNAASDYIRGSDFKRFEKDVEKKYPLLEGRKVKEWDWTGTVTGNPPHIYFQVGDDMLYVPVTDEQMEDYVKGGTLKKKLIQKLAKSGNALTHKEWRQKNPAKGLNKYLDQGGRVWDHKITESTIGVKTERSFKPNDLTKALDKAKIKYKFNRLSMTLSVIDLDKKYFDDAKKVVDDLGLSIMMAKESKVNEDYSQIK
jgi:hypothetical protein